MGVTRGEAVKLLSRIASRLDPDHKQQRCPSNETWRYTRRDHAHGRVYCDQSLHRRADASANVFMVSMYSISGREDVRCATRDRGVQLDRSRRDSCREQSHHELGSHTTSVSAHYAGADTIAQAYKGILGRCSCEDPAGTATD